MSLATDGGKVGEKEWPLDRQRLLVWHLVLGVVLLSIVVREKAGNGYTSRAVRHDNTGGSLYQDDLLILFMGLVVDSTSKTATVWPPQLHSKPVRRAISSPV